MGAPAQKASDPSIRVRPDIYRYHHYREFLSDYLEYLKEAEPELSRREISRRSGVGSSYLPMVLSGHRNFTDKGMDKILPHLGLNASEESYFRWLTVLEDSELDQERMDALKNILRFRTYRKLNTKEVEAYRYLTHWYYVAIREMASLPEFEADPKWIQSRLQSSVPLQDVETALQFLVDQGFILIDKKGRARNTGKTVDCERGVFRVALGSFQKEIFDLAAQSIQDVPRKERNLIGHMLSISENQFEEVELILKKAREDIQAVGEKFLKETEYKKDLEGRVYYVGLLAFPLSKKGESK